MSLEDLRSRYPLSSLEVGATTVELVRTGGSGRPLLMLPGAQGNAEIFFRQILAWGGDRDLACVTYPDWTDGRRLADFVQRLADRIGWQSFDLVGSSFGGYVAQWVAVLHPSRVRKLVVGNSFADPTPAQAPERLQALQAKDADTVKVEALARVEASPDGELKTVLRELMGRLQPATLLRSRMLAVQLAVPLPPLGISDDRLMLVECDNDPLIPPAMRQAIRALHPSATFASIAGGGHYPYISQAAAYNAAVGAFIND